MNVLSEALQPGRAIGPATLLAVLEKEDSPLDAIMRVDGAGTIATAIEQDFSFLRFPRMQVDAVDGEAKKRWAGLIRWLLATIKNWKRSDDTRLRELAAVLLTASLCGGDTDLWCLLPEENAPSVEFLGILGVFVAKRQIVYDFRATASPPIWESEFVEAFQKADAAGDWPGIASMWPRLDHVGRPDALFMATVRCLARFGFAELVRATDALQQSHPVMELAVTLSAHQRLSLAIASGSERVRFCCAFTSVTQRPEAIALSVDEESALLRLLIKVAAAPQEWRKWMMAFNTYPLRYPLLHRPLGQALARASYDAAAIYIDSIKFHPIRVTEIDESRTLVSTCLRSFSQEASLAHRQAVWAHAHRRWLEWRFGAADPATSLFDIARSALDFAVASYATECIGAAERENAIADIQKRLPEVELTWHATETDCTTEWNRLLSLFQPYAHACRVAEIGEDPLVDTGLYYPFDLSRSLYHRIMFRVPTH